MLGLQSFENADSTMMKHRGNDPLQAPRPRQKVTLDLSKGQVLR